MVDREQDSGFSAEKEGPRRIRFKATLSYSPGGEIARMASSYSQIKHPLYFSITRGFGKIIRQIFHPQGAINREKEYIKYDHSLNSVIDEFRMQLSDSLSYIFDSKIDVGIDTIQSGSLSILGSVYVGYDIISKYKNFNDSCDLICGQAQKVLNHVFGRIEPVTIDVTGLTSAASTTATTGNSLKSPPIASARNVAFALLLAWNLVQLVILGWYLSNSGHDAQLPRRDTGGIESTAEYVRRIADQVHWDLLEVKTIIGAANSHRYDEAMTRKFDELIQIIKVPDRGCRLW
jgi:hypothetical protein